MFLKGLGRIPINTEYTSIVLIGVNVLVLGEDANILDQTNLQHARISYHIKLRDWKQKSRIQLNIYTRIHICHIVKEFLLPI